MKGIYVETQGRELIASLTHKDREVKMLCNSPHLSIFIHCLWHHLSHLPAGKLMDEAVALLRDTVVKTDSKDIFNTLIIADIHGAGGEDEESLSLTLSRYEAVWRRLHDPTVLFGLAMISLVQKLDPSRESALDRELVGRFIASNEKTFLSSFFRYIAPLFQRSTDTRGKGRRRTSSISKSLGSYGDGIGELLEEGMVDEDRTCASLGLLENLIEAPGVDVLAWMRRTHLTDQGGDTALRLIYAFASSYLVQWRPPASSISPVKGGINQASGERLLLACLHFLHRFVKSMTVAELPLMPHLQRCILTALAQPSLGQGAGGSSGLLELLLESLDNTVRLSRAPTSTGTGSSSKGVGRREGGGVEGYLTHERSREDAMRRLRLLLVNALLHHPGHLNRGPGQVSVWLRVADRLFVHLHTEYSITQCIIPVLGSLCQSVRMACMNIEDESTPIPSSEKDPGENVMVDLWTLELRVRLLEKLLLYYLEVTDVSVDADAVSDISLNSTTDLESKEEEEGEASEEKSGGSTASMGTGGLLSLFSTSNPSSKNGRATNGKGGSRLQGRVTVQEWMMEQLVTIFATLLRVCQVRILPRKDCMEVMSAQQALTHVFSRLLARYRKAILEALVEVWCEEGPWLQACDLPHREWEMVELIEGLEYREVMLAVMDHPKSSPDLDRTPRIRLLARLVRHTPLADLYAVVSSIEEFCRSVAAASSNASSLAGDGNGIKTLLSQLLIETWKRVRGMTVESEWRSLRESISELCVALLDSMIADWAGVIGDERAIAKVRGVPEDRQVLEELGLPSVDSSSVLPEVDLVRSVCFTANVTLPQLPTLTLPETMLSRLTSRLTTVFTLPILRVDPGKRPHPLYLLGLYLLDRTVHQSLPTTAWKREVWELYGDASFFRVPTERLGKGKHGPWRPILQAVVHYDREKLTEALSRLTASSTNIFTSRETEALQKAQAVHRFAYLILCGEKDQYLPFLPGLQEKIVELLKTQSHSLVVLREVYLCLRVILFRHSSKYLTGFWPLIITEMVSFFTGMAEKTSPLSEKDEQVLVVICRFLDLIITLAPTEFQLFQWIFVRELSERKDGPEGKGEDGAVGSGGGSSEEVGEGDEGARKTSMTGLKGKVAPVDSAAFFSPTLESLGRRLGGAHWDAPLHMLDVPGGTESKRRPTLEVGTSPGQLETFFATLGDKLLWQSSSPVDEVYVDEQLELEFFELE
ncbi:hypothetical protein BJ684DRAFT_16260, partial [Piptocephalis cylindrospora]